MTWTRFNEAPIHESGKLIGAVLHSHLPNALQ